MASRITPRQYDLLLTRSQKFAIGFPLVMLIVMPLIFFFAFSLSGARDSAHPQPPFFPYFPLVVFLALAGFFGWIAGTLPYRVTATIDQTLVFKSLLRVRTVRVSDLISIEPHSLRMQAGLSGYALRHRDGKILYPGQFTGFYLLLAELKSANPMLEIRGC